MGLFTQRPSAYAPPLDGREPSPTLVGGEAGPARTPDDWRIELRRYPIRHRGHAVLVLVGPGNTDMSELNGWAESRQTEKRRPIGADGDKLVATEDERFGPNAKWVADLASGSYEEINRLWRHGLRAADQINVKNYDYKAHDPSFELGGDGGQIQNSNSVAYTLSRAMGVDTESVLRKSGTERVFPGWGRDLLDPKYRPYIAPPLFPMQSAP